MITGQVLVVGSNGAVRAELEAVLAEAGFQATSVNTVAEAREQLAAQRPSVLVLVLDLEYSDGQGPDFLKEIRAQSATSDLPVVVLTASGTAKTFGAFGQHTQCLERPYGRTLVLATVATATSALPPEPGAPVVSLAKIPSALLEEEHRHLAERARSACRVLVVDDSKTYLLAVSDVLRRDGLEVIEARSGQECLEAVTNLDIDCVVLDLVMPGISGIEVCEMLRAKEVADRLPILVLTGHESQESMLAALSAGADDFVAKQSGFAVILARVRTLVHRRELESVNRDIIEKMHRADVETARERERILAKSEFVAGVSHEVRTPLNGVLGLLDVLAHTDLSAGQEDLVRTAIESGQVLLSIVNDILDTSRVDAGRLEIDHSPFDLHEVLRGTMRAFSTRVAQKKLDFGLDLPDETPRALMGDSARLAQILNNLVGNAIKFTDEGSICVRIERDLLPEKLGVSVVDTGIGIAADRVEVVFDRFRQADRSIATRYGGTGLGLTISKQLAELMQGSLSVDSELGKGATFRLVLPLERNEAEGELAANRSPNVEGMRVFVADDSSLTAQLVHDALVESGAECVLSPTFSGGADAASKGAIDAVLLRAPRDSQGDSIPRAQVRRQLGAWSERVPLVILGGSPDAARDAGFDGWIAWPVWRASLLRVLDVARGATPGKSFFMDAPGTAIATRIERPSRPRLSVLVVDDNAVNLEVAELVLERFDCDTDCVASGREALDRLNANSYDLMVLDCQMPIMDGFEVARRVREIPALKEFPIIALTAEASDAARRRARESGMSDYLSKPLDARALEACLKKWAPRPTAGESTGSIKDAPPVASAEPEAEEESIDWECLTSLRVLASRKGEGVLTGLLSNLVKGMHEHVSAMRAHCATGIADELEEVARRAHTMRGSSSTGGAMHVAALTLQVEEQAGAGEDPSTLVTELAAAVDHYAERVLPWSVGA